MVRPRPPPHRVRQPRLAPRQASAATDPPMSSPPAPYSIRPTAWRSFAGRPGSGKGANSVSAPIIELSRNPQSLKAYAEPAATNAVTTVIASDLGPATPGKRLPRPQPSAGLYRRRPQGDLYRGRHRRRSNRRRPLRSGGGSSWLRVAPSGKASRASRHRRLQPHRPHHRDRPCRPPAAGQPRHRREAALHRPGRKVRSHRNFFHPSASLRSSTRRRLWRCFDFQ